MRTTGGRRVAAFLPMRKLLIERSAPLDAADDHGDTPLEVAVHCLEEQSEWTPNDYTVDIAAALIQAGASLELVKMALAAAVLISVFWTEPLS